MTQSPTEAVVEPARDHPRALHGERSTHAEGAQLDWKDFDRRTGVVERPASGTAGSEDSNPPATRKGRIDAWEDEGGAST